MTLVGSGMARMNLNQRAQHGLLLLGVGGALATGLALGRPFGAGAATLHTLHVAAGIGTSALLVYHLLYLAVRNYVEGRHWSGFPLRLSRADIDEARAEVRYLLGRRSERPEAGLFRVSQKALYWWTLTALALLGTTGLGLVFWASLGTLSVLSPIAVLHRASALLLFATLLWHLYGVLTWDGHWWPEWSWVNGTLDAGKAALKVPGAWRRHLRRLEEIASGTEASPDQQERARQARQKDEVQAELEQGNSYALEERYVEALFHYRRALELYPGYSQARYNMARVMVRMGEREMAREAFREFLEAEPFHPLARKAREAIRELDEGGRQS